jgi:hypothetical protein
MIDQVAITSRIVPRAMERHQVIVAAGKKLSGVTGPISQSSASATCRSQPACACARSARFAGLHRPGLALKASTRNL